MAAEYFEAMGLAQKVKPSGPQFVFIFPFTNNQYVVVNVFRYVFLLSHSQISSS